MLTYKISSKDIKRENLPIEVENIGGKSVVWKADSITVNSPKHGLDSGETVKFARSDGEDIQFLYSTEIETVEENSFTIPDFPYRLLSVNAAGYEYEKYHYADSERKFLILSLGDGVHDFLENRLVGKYSASTTYINEFIYGDYSTAADGVRRCDGDYVLYEETFLYTANVDASTGKYAFTKAGSNERIYSYVKNTKANVFVVLDEETDDEFIEAYGDRQLYGETWEYSAGTIILKNCIIPVLKTGKNDRHIIMWEGENIYIASLIARKCRNLTFYAKDERFIAETSETSDLGLKCVFTNGTVLYRTNYSARFSEPLLQDFGANLFQEDTLRTDFVNKLINSSKNKVIDYEKKCFSPVYIINGEMRDLEELRFNLHFRERTAEPIKGVEEGEERVIGYTYNDWKTSDDLYWNNYASAGSILVPAHGNTPEQADLIGYLGFTDEDVIKMRNRISRSFLRLSFYNTRDRRTQKLLFTSTMFLNGEKLYGQYSSNVRTGSVKNGSAVNGADGEYVFTENATERLSAEFSCRNKYNTTESSEGFYLYLFPGLLDEDGKATIYMKVEFSHAKYGYTIPFTIPTDSNGNVISPTDSRFPRNYEAVDGSGMKYINMKELYSDMYVEVRIEFDYNQNRYIWYFPNISNSEVLNLNLFEPRLNSGEDYQAVLNYGGNIGYEGGNIQGSVIVPDGKQWRMVSCDERMSISPTQGNGATSITVNVSPNMGAESGDTRQMNATFECGDKTFTLIVVQDKANYPFYISPSAVESDWEGSSTTITINDPENFGWDIIRKDYVTVSDNGGVGTKTVTVTFGRNNSLSPINGVIVVRDRTFNIEINVTVTQFGVVSDWGGSPLNITDFPNEGGTFDVEIYDPDGFGSAFVPNSYIPWITLDGAIDVPSEHKRIFTFSVAQNDTTSERYGGVVIKDEALGLFYHETTVSQVSTVGKVYVNLSGSQFYWEWPSTEAVNVSSDIYMEMSDGSILWLSDPTVNRGFTNSNILWGVSPIQFPEISDKSIYGTTRIVDWTINATFVDDPNITFSDSGRVSVFIPLSTSDQTITVNLPPYIYNYYEGL